MHCRTWEMPGTVWIGRRLRARDRVAPLARVAGERAVNDPREVADLRPACRNVRGVGPLPAARRACSVGCRIRHRFAALDASTISPRLTPPPDPIPGWRITGRWRRSVSSCGFQRWNGGLSLRVHRPCAPEFANDLIWSIRCSRAVCVRLRQQGQVKAPSWATGAAGGRRRRTAALHFGSGVAVSFWQHARCDARALDGRVLRHHYHRARVAQQHGRYRADSDAVGLERR